MKRNAYQYTRMHTDEWVSTCVSMYLYWGGGQNEPLRWREWLNTKENDRNQECFQISSSFSFHQSLQNKKKKKKVFVGIPFKFDI